MYVLIFFNENLRLRQKIISCYASLIIIIEFFVIYHICIKRMVSKEYEDIDTCVMN